MIGVDIQKIARIKKSLESDAFAERVFTAAEREYCDSRALPEQSYAGMFCAKEAAVKAVKQGFGAISPRSCFTVTPRRSLPDVTSTFRYRTTANMLLPQCRFCEGICTHSKPKT